jgi:HSP20 family protein
MLVGGRPRFFPADGGVEMVDRENNNCEETNPRMEAENHYLTPAVDIYETDEALVLLADIPGVKASDLDIDLTGKTVTIIAGATRDCPEGRTVVKEFTGGNYFRQFLLGPELDGGNISATLANGVLTITVPKLRGRRSRRIPISV